MSNEEIILTMSKPKSAGLINKYKAIFQISTGQPWRGCMCGNGFDRLYNAAKNYALALSKQQEQKLNIETNTITNV